MKHNYLNLMAFPIHKRIRGRRAIAGWLMALTWVVASSWMALNPTPARADYKAKYHDVVCGSGMSLSQASGVPAGAVHSYVFRGFCSLRTIYDTGPYVEGHPPLVGTGRWDKASSTYHESVRSLSAIKFEYTFARGPNGMWGTYTNITTAPEEANFTCDVDPVINKSAHCSLNNQFNGTGWGDQHDGFAWRVLRDRPLLAGLATEAQAKARSKSNPPISCRGLHLTAATGVPKGHKRTYKFSGTCKLYHTQDGSGGLRVTHVLLRGEWDQVAQQAKEGVTVLTMPIQGGGGWSTTYTCDLDPWLNPHAQCSKTAGLGHQPPVYDPITDVINRHPVALGMADITLAAKMSGSHQGSSKQTSTKSTMQTSVGLGHRGRVTVSRQSHRMTLAKPKFKITNAVATLTLTCRLDRLAEVDFGLQNMGGPLRSHTMFAYVHVAEPGSTGLKGHDQELPAIAAGKTWYGHIMVGTSKANLSKLPGEHMLLISIGPSNAKKSTLGFVAPPVYRTVLTVPGGHCQPKLQVRSPSQVHAKTKPAAPLRRGGALKPALPAIQTRP